MRDRVKRRVGPLIVGGFAAVALLSSQPTRADDASSFFAGKTVTLVIGLPPGGGYDAYGRLLQRHLGQHIPGSPKVVATNMPGAGSMVAANYIYNTAPSDGTAIALFSSSAAMEPLMGDKDAKFDPSKFGWVGSMAQDVAYCGVWNRPGVPTTFAQMMKKQVVIGAGGTAAITYQHPMVLRTLLGAKIKIVTGYGGTSEINLAMQRGEVEGSCGLFSSSIEAHWANEVKSGQLKLFIQMGSKRSSEFGAIPSVYDFAKSAEDKSVLNMLFGQLLLTRPIAAPPGVPRARLAVLRKAFQDTMKDKDFLADAKKIGVLINPATGEQVEALLQKFSAYPPQVIKKAQQAIGR